MNDLVKEIVADFVTDARTITIQLTALIAKLEDGALENPENFVTFAQKVDGIMGCAKTLSMNSDGSVKASADVIANLSEACKSLGYRSSQISNEAQANIVVAFLADALEYIDFALNDLQKESATLNQERVNKINDRLNWVNSKIQLTAEQQAAINKRFGI
jgi:ABC-type transporter Mla subunit MlaD